ncbi:hypothetical protein ISS07_03235 [Candidatus Woesearchaeota archaeon]|nr:hypothetical protein [Candidatus Woesearchaeota archaeon]
MVKKYFALILFVLVLFSVSVFAEDPSRLLSNSEDWKDVYSTIQYGIFNDKSADFLVSNRHATLILNQISTNDHIWAISSEEVPFIVGYQNLLQGRGYSSEEFTFENVNLGLGELLEDVTKFIILDDAYGYNAISVAPYAAVTKSYVLFADEDNINDVEDFLDERNVESLIIYGQVDREVKDSLAKYDPETINEEGDRFLNNIEIVKKYQEVANSKQAILTNGEFIEKELMSGSEPVVFIGTNNVPDVVRDYIAESDIEVGVLIGNELVGTATFIRRQLGISVFVKFAQGARNPEGAISQVEALDMFYLPVYNVNLEIESIRYNRATGKLEVTIRNIEDQASYFIGTYSLTAADGTRVTVGDVGANFIDGNELKTIVYDIDQLPEGSLSVDIFVIYGESPASLEKEIRKTLDVESVRVLDACEITINEITVNLRNKQFYVNVENIGSADCYVDMELVDLRIAGEKTTLGMEDVVKLKFGEDKSLRIKVADFEEEDVEDNERIKVRAYYGERETSLIKILEGNFDLLIKGIDFLFYGLLVVIVILLWLILFKRRKKPAQHVPHHTHQHVHEHKK